ncbi:MAG TPA: extracellular solute-binding protein [Xanthobacteraceae bacterium]|nr:extracellular solute-binding protein [Xanthobacteraceae bacterium]
MKRHLLAVLSALALAIAIQPASAQEKDWNKLVEAAKKEGTLTVYHSQLGAPHWKKVVDAFKAKYGIDVKEFDARASEISERIRVEQTSSRFIGDVEFHGLSTIVDQMNTGFLDDIGEIPNAKNVRSDVPPGHAKAVPAWLQFTCLLVNTNLVKPADEPKTYKDILDPKWKGKLLSDETRAIGSGQTMFAVTYQKYGADFAKQLREQNLVIDRDLQQASRRVARGEYPIFLQQIIAFAAPLKSLPVKVIIPEEGCPVTPIQGAVLKGAPHPNAARLFINHFLDMDSQVTYADAWMGTVVNGVADKLTDADAKRYAQAKIMGYISYDIRDAMLKAAKDTFQ